MSERTPTRFETAYSLLEIITLFEQERKLTGKAILLDTAAGPHPISVKFEQGGQQDKCAKDEETKTEGEKDPDARNPTVR